MVGLVLVRPSILQRWDGFPARAKVAEEWDLFNAHSCDGCGCVGTNFLVNVAFALREERRARLFSSLCLKVRNVCLVFVPSLADALHRKPSCAEYITKSLEVWWILCVPLYFSKKSISCFICHSNLDWKVGFTRTRGARSPASQSEINQSNQKNIMQCISAGRCYSLPSSSIDLQSRS